MERAGAGDLDVVDVGRVADLELDCRIHLEIIRTLMAFDQHRARPLSDRRERAHEHGRRLPAGIDEDEMDRTRERNSRGDIESRISTLAGLVACENALLALEKFLPKERWESGGLRAEAIARAEQRLAEVRSHVEREQL